MKFLVVTVLLLFIPFVARAEAAGKYSPLKLELKDNKISLIQGYNIYTYPSRKGGFTGIKKVLQEDLTGDGKNEYILAVQLESGEPPAKAPYGVVLICEQRDNNLEIRYQIITGSHSPDFDLVDVNKDGMKDVIASGANFPRWRHLKIVSWQNGNYVLLWDKGDDDTIISQIFEINENEDAQIRVGKPAYHYSTSTTYWFNNERWETWVWDGESFVLEKEAPISTDSDPLEKEVPISTDSDPGY